MRILFLLLFSLIFAKTHAQVCDFSEDYSDDAAWTFVYGYPGAGGCGDEPQTGTLEIAGGVMDFNDVCDANDTRMYRDIGFAVSDVAWTANFEFTPTLIGDMGVERVGHVIFSLSAGYNAPFNDSWEHCIANDQDGIMVWYLSEYYPSDPTTGFYIYAKNELTYVNTAVGDNINALPGTTYYLTFKRIATDFVTLEVYLDPERTDLLDAIECFEIPDNITGLDVLQHGNAPWGYYGRVLTGTLDNTCIYDNATTAAYITGPVSICPGTLGTYEISGYGTDEIEWVLPDEITYTSVGDNIINVSDWGGLETATISAIITSECTEDVLSLEVDLGLADTTFETIQICENDTVTVFGTEVSDAGIFVGNFISVGGCDSVHIVTVEETDSIISTFEYFICTGDSIEIFGETIYTSGVFSESYFTTGGCDSIVNIIVTAYPELSVTFTNDTVTSNLTGVILSPIYTGSNYTISWSPDENLSCNDCPNPVVIPTENGWYYVTITDINGCSSTDSIYVTLDITSIVDIPNAFSPNGDGVNDFFGILNAGNCEIIYFNIYNRWGEMIFTTNNISGTWDGTYKEIPQEIGTYVYVADGYCDEKKFTLTGTLTLVR